MVMDYDEKYEMFQRERAKMPEVFESPEAISKALLETDRYQTMAINTDSTKGNLNPKELRQVRADGGVILEIEEAEGMAQMNGINLDMMITKIKTNGHQGLLNTTSRSKSGWVSVLAKTDKHINIQSMEQYASDISDGFNEQVSQSVGDKLRNNLPFLKKKEM